MAFPLSLFLTMTLTLTFLLFLSQRTHLLMVLLAIETIVLTLTTLIVLMYALYPQTNPFFLFILLTLGACEASLGLAILVAMSRSAGSDLLSTLTLNKC